jgi:tRNA (cytidine56-2'-O)-methyltransferase
MKSDPMISILRIGHRLGRDDRISTHCGLVARAFGASEIIYSGETDDKLIEGLKDVTKRWGGQFKIAYEKNWRRLIKKYKKKSVVVHLTMYGLPVNKEIGKLRRKKNLLVIIGSEKVPGEIYQLADYNIAVTSQPHSEVAALAVFLHEYFHGKELNKKFKKAKIKIIPQSRGKKVIESSRK